MQKSPIKIPKEPEPKAVVQPDIIPAQHSQPAVPPPAAFTNDLVAESVAQSDNTIAEPPPEELYSNVDKRHVEEAAVNVKSVDLIEETVHEPQSPTKEQISPTKVQAASAEIPQATEHIDPIYQNQEDLTEYIEDTGVKAVRGFQMIGGLGFL